MGADARHTFLAAHERRMLTLTTHHQPSGRRVSKRLGLQSQRHPIGHTLLEPDEPYVSFRWK
jgi:CRISPR-associated protein Cas1